MDTEHDPAVLREAILARLPLRCAASGQIRWPAIPALLDHYAQVLESLFAGFGRKFSAEEVELLRGELARELTLGFEAAPFSVLVVDYRTEAPPGSALLYEISHRVVTIADEYAAWLKTRKPPLFGAHPDAKVLSLARSLGAPHDLAILDVGAGTGRNTLPLAREGFRVDAVELAPPLAALLRADLERAGVNARVFEGDALDAALEIPQHHYQLVVLAEVVASHFRDVAQLRRLFERAESWLAPGGLLLFSAFLAGGDYQPDLLAKQASQVFWCCLFTRRELEQASRGLALTRVSDESTYAFERRHLAEDAWPPTGWFETWARGGDLFELPLEQSPHELRWLVYRRTPAAADPSALFSTAVNMHVRCARERVFDAVTDDAQRARIFGPFLPLPGIADSQLLGAAAPAAGVRRRVTWSDASVTIEELLEFARPLQQRYRWDNTWKGPLAWLVRSVESDWLFASTPSGTVVYWTCRIEPGHRLTRPLMNIALVAFRRWMRRSLDSLRALVEAS
jgi:SAM-dependent methyltransferase